MTNHPPSMSQNVGQEQFLRILSREEALARFEAALFPRSVPSEERALADALGLAITEDVLAPIDVPPFDRSNVEGFAVRAADLAAASETRSVRLLLNAEAIACGVQPQLPVIAGTATLIATGGPLPRGADAIVMVEHTQPEGDGAIEVRRGVSPGQFVSYAGSDIARGEVLLRAGTVIGSREIGMLAACGIARLPVARKLRVAILSTGDELVQPGDPLRPAGIYDANGPIVSAAVTENGGDAHFLGALPDEEASLETAMREALADNMPAGSEVPVTLFTPQVRIPDLVVIGSHCVGLDIVAGVLARSGLSVRSLAVGSLGGLAAAKRGECDLAPIHLFDPETQSYNAPFLGDGLELVSGWRRMQGLVFRPGDKRFEGHGLEGAVRAAVADPECIMVNRNQGAGTRVLIDQLLGASRPDGYWNQPRSHNAVAAAVAQKRADWGVTIAPVARASGLGFIPLTEEHYDFALVSARKERPAVQAFLAALASDETRSALERAGFSRPEA